MSDKKEEKTDDSGNCMIFGMLIGMSIGFALGHPLFNNMAAGMASGTCIGMAIGSFIDCIKKKWVIIYNDSHSNTRIFRS